MEDMETMLNGLREMRTSNPEVFKQAMKSLGLPIDEPEGVGMDDTTSLSKMAEAIQQMRNQETPGKDSENILMSKDSPKQPKGISITPSPGFAFKTLRLSDKMKIFVNMAQHEAIDEPGLKKKLDENGEEIEGMNIPMSVGAPVWGEDKKGVKCIIYDIIVNPVVITESVTDKTGKYRDFICQLGIQYLEQKYKEELDKRYKLPKLKYMGETIASQMIQDRKSMPKIQEVSSKTNPAAAKAKAQAAAKAVVEVVDKDLQYRTEWLQAANCIDYASQEREVVVNEVLDAFSAAVSPSALFTLQPYTHQLLEYVDPIFEPSENTIAVVIQAEVTAYDLDISAVSVQISPFKVSLKLPGYRKVVLYLACAVLPSASYYTLCPPYEGCLSALRLQVILLVDRTEWTASADPGSKTWLLSQALSGEASAEQNPYSPNGAYRSQDSADVSSNSKTHTVDGEGEGFAEDKFHLRLPADVDQYTGMKLDGAAEAPELSPLAVRNGIPTGNKTSSSTTNISTAAVEAEEDEQEFPEDRFHKKDAASNYMIQQREQARRDKWAKHEKEKAERADDPNVEYVDMDDFRPGGKYGPKDEKKTTAVLENSVQTEEMRRAAEIVANSANITTQENGIKLSSALWTELLD